MRRSTVPVVAAATALALLFTGCSFSGGGGSSTNKNGKPVRKITIEYAAFPTVDPQRLTFGSWLAKQGLLEGLVLKSPQGNGVQPGAADKWTESTDGKVYTFHLRSDAKWSDGTPVTAEDFLFSYQRLLSPPAKSGVEGASDYPVDLGITGATDFLSGKLTDFSKVGIKATDKQTLQICLDAPNTDFLAAMADPWMLPLPAHTLKAHPKNWQSAKYWVGNGPYIISSWTPNVSMTLTPNKHYWDPSQVKLDRVVVRMTTDDTKAALHYQNKEVDVAPVDPPDLPRFQKDSTLSKSLQSIPAFYLTYLATMQSQNPALEDVRVRKALSLGMDRADVAKACAGCRAADTLVPGIVPDAGANVATPEDLAQAKQLLTQAGYPGGKGLTVNMLLGGNATPPLQAIAANWEHNLGIKVKIDVQEVGVYATKRAALAPKNYVGVWSSATSGGPSWRFWAAGSWGPTVIGAASIPGKDFGAYAKMTLNGPTAASSAYLASHESAAAKQYAALVAQANSTVDAAAAQKLYIQAARVRADMYYILPAFFTDNYYAIRTNITGVHLLNGYYFPFYLRGVGVTGSK